MRYKMDNSDESNLDKERLNQFVARALSESNRMQGEVNNAEQQRQELINNYGSEAVSAWMQEHAEQVLSQEEIRLIQGSTKLLSLN
ncbi:hypothetical protein TrispH2_002951 [Trichoplax sp. H2]|nr:hypothetical protein TrispH2_002951 [Trichoplax sp. H2]|eukprot:RDD45108.1 hypothetical protein TrispH2_002951 [Trichoplax sp. H2]